MAKVKKPVRGATRMKEFGYKLVSVWVDENELALLDKAATGAGQKLATYIRERAVASAGQELKPAEELDQPDADLADADLTDERPERS